MITNNTRILHLYRTVSGYQLQLVKLFTVINNYLPLRKIHTINRIIYC